MKIKQAFTLHLYLSLIFFIIIGAAESATANKTINNEQSVLDSSTTELIEFTQEEQNFIKTHPLLTASNEQDWAPFDFTENGVAKGFSVDFIKLLVQKIGIKVNFI